MLVDKSYLFNQLLWNDINLLGFISDRVLHSMEDAKRFNKFSMEVLYQLQQIRCEINTRTDFSLIRKTIEAG